MENIWKLVKNIKSKLSFEKGCTYDGLYYCYDYENEIKPQVEELQKTQPVPRRAKEEFR